MKIRVQLQPDDLSFTKNQTIAPLCKLERKRKEQSEKIGVWLGSEIH